MIDSQTPEKLFVRCYAYKDDGLWLAFCIDFNLAVQADTPEEAVQNLSEQISDYFVSAFDEDEKTRKYLLTRKAPLSIRFRYHVIRLLIRFHLAKDKCYRLFEKMTPVKPAYC